MLENFSVTTSPAITVNAANSAGAPSSNPTVCVNTAISPNITIATTGATGIGAATGLPAGVSAVWAANVITISGTPTTTVGSPFNYSIPLTGGCGTVNATGTITVNPVTSLVSQPVPASLVCAGSSVMASVSAVGTGTLTYQWYKNSLSTPAASQTASTLSLPGSTTADTGSYSVVVTGSCGSVTSTAFRLTVVAFPVPVISPSAVTICAGTSITLTASDAITGRTTTFAWTGGAATPAISVTTAGTYSVTATTSGCASVTNAVVRVNPVTSLVSQPVTGSLVCVGASVVASVSATGTGTNGIPGSPFSYQWYQNSSAVSGQTSATLSLASTTTANTGSYSVVVTGYCNSLTSTAFSLTVSGSGSPGCNCSSFVSVKPGNWNDPTVWSCGTLPTAGSVVNLKHVVSIPASYTALSGTVRYDAGGGISYQTGAKLRLGL